MLSQYRQNHHKSKLPSPGSVGYLISKYDRLGTAYHYRGKQLYQVVAYPLCDNILPWSKGIHTAYFKSLKDQTVHQLSGFYFEERSC